ncbi:hypothetical protein ACFOW6_16635 [Fodinicurvata halophila]|uniref:Uncharacterized protein n=1 Tax=Fodinicurvata halophila TaxID=1419723 RepID=A0ABV8UQU5_9PROT
MSDFIPTFPRTVAGTRWREPLSHPEIDALGKRADVLYSLALLSVQERTALLQLYRELQRADRSLSNLLEGKPLPHVEVRPSQAMRGGVAAKKIEHDAGFVARFREYIVRLEHRHGLGDGDADDI